MAPEPDLTDFLADDEPANKSRRILISIVAAVTVLVMVAVAVIFAFAWTTQDSPAPSRTPNDTYSAQESDPRITDATTRYVAAVNSGIASEYLDSVCQPIRDQLTDIADREPAVPAMAVTKVFDVRIDGDIATASVSITPADSPDATPRTDKLRFLNDGGWKFCGQAQ